MADPITSEELARLQTARNTLRDKGVEIGITTPTAKLDVIATAFDGIENRGAVSAQVQEGDTYTIPKGYHNGSGTVSGVSGGGNYTLQSKAVTPTKNQQNVTPDSGYYGLSDVTVAPIPSAYQNVSSVDATAADVLANKIIVTADGTIVTGTMPNIGAVGTGSVPNTLDTEKTSYTVPKGYHNGSGKVWIVLEEKTATLSRIDQEITPSAGKVLSKVTVPAIPSELQDVSDVSTQADHVLAGDFYVDREGNVVEGTMPTVDPIDGVLSVSNPSIDIPYGYHYSQGAVSIALEEKSVTPTKSAQTITPASGKVLSKVSMAAIPAAYQDVTGVTAAVTDVLAGKKYVNAAGELKDGTMANNGAISLTMDGLTVTSASIPAGYTSGGTVSLTNDIAEALAAI